MEKPLYEDTIPGGCHWSFVIKRGHVLRLTDIEGGANCAMLFYNPVMPLERYNMPDTLKCQHTFALTKGHCLYSDMGHVFCSIIDDTVGWHDTATGTCNKALVARKWGEKTYQQARNDYHRNGRDSFLVELAKYGLGKRDIAANINFFSKIATDEEGTLGFVEDNSNAGDYVDLRFDMDTLVILHCCPHPLNPATHYPVKPVRYSIREAEALHDHDICRDHCGENQRGFVNNYLYNLGH